MTTRHWDDDELIGHLYGVGPGDGHLEECPECARRWQTLLSVRQRVMEPPPESEHFLADQRRRIHGRLGTSRPKWLPIAPAAIAAAAVIVLAVVLYRPGPAPAPEPGISDSELYADVYSMVQSDEPQAVEPMHALFEAQQ